VEHQLGIHIGTLVTADKVRAGLTKAPRKVSIAIRDSMGDEEVISVDGCRDIHILSHLYSQRTDHEARKLDFFYTLHGVGNGKIVTDQWSDRVDELSIISRLSKTSMD